MRSLHAELPHGNARVGDQVPSVRRFRVGRCGGIWAHAFTPWPPRFARSAHSHLPDVPGGGVGSARLRARRPPTLPQRRPRIPQPGFGSGLTRS